MTDQTPIVRAGEALRGDNCTCEDACYCPDWHREAHLAYEAIDTDQLATVILRTELPGGIKVGHADMIALAVKNWLTGKDQT